MISREEAKAALTRMLSERLTDELWEFLEDEGYVSAVVDPKEPETINDLAAKARKVLAISSSRQPADAPKMLCNGRKKKASDKERHAMRQEALSLVFAEYVRSNDEWVIKFRNDVLGKECPLSFEEVESWIKSQNKKEDKKGATRGGLLEYGIPDNEWLQVCPTAKGGDLDYLRKISESLADTYKWSKAQATVFVLTDIAPEIPLYKAEWELNFGFKALSRINLTLDPALTDKEVSEIYRRTRQEQLKKDKKGKVRFRILSDKAYSLAIFEAEQPEENTYAEKMRAWNKLRPEWEYTEVSNFGRDSNQAIRRLIQPDYFDHPLMKG